jgi:trans-aconitate methyltransferase
MGRKSVFHYLKRGKFAKAVSVLHPGCHQGPNRTALDRYPEVFAAAAAAAPDARRILSFGCSSGEECVTLAEYFPKSEIIGAEINVLSLVKAWKKRTDRIRFVYSSDRTLSSAWRCFARRRSNSVSATIPLRFLRSARCFLSRWLSPEAYW